MGSSTVVPALRLDAGIPPSGSQPAASHENVHTSVDMPKQALLSEHHDDDNGKKRRKARRWCACSRNPSLYWVEKLLLCVQYGQLFGLLWAFARPWPLPPFFRDNTRWTTWINVDAPSAYTWQIDSQQPEERGSAYGEISGYWMIALAWACLPALLLGAYILLLYVGWKKYWDMRVVRRWGSDIAVVLGLLGQLPAGLALARFYVCSEVGTTNVYRLVVDPEMECFTAQHLIISVICLPTTLAVLLGFPLWMCWHIRKQLVFDKRYEHERYLRWKEAEYVHDLSFDWRRDQMWIFSSFVRNGMHTYDRPLWMFSVTALIVTFAYGRKEPAIMTDIFFAVVVLWSLRQSFSPAYRCNTTNVLASVFYSGFSLFTFWGVMRAHGLTNSMTVDSIWFRTVSIMNIVLLACMIFIMLVSCYPAFGWPTGYIGPHLWRRLLKEEIEATKVDMARVAQKQQGQFTSLHGAITSRDMRTHEFQQLTARTRELLRNAVSRPPSRVAPSDSAAMALQSVREEEAEDLDAERPMPIPSDFAPSIPDRRISLVDGGVDAGDLERLLAAREREYELRQVYGDATAEQMMLAEHERSFRWEESVPLAATARKRVRADGLSARDGSLASARAPHVASMFEDDDDDDAESQVSVPLELRQLTAAEVSALEAVWIQLVKRARELLKTNQHLPPEIVNVPELRKQAKTLKREYRRAHICRHVLSWTLEETVDDLGALADACQSRTVFPNPVLEDLLHILKRRLDQRDRDYALAPVKRKHVALKLFALSSWMNGRKIARLRIKGVNEEFFKHEATPIPLHDELTMYTHIQSIFHDVSGMEISLMGLTDLLEVVNDVIPARLLVDLRSVPLDCPLDVDSTKHLAACNGKTLNEETKEMVCAAYDRIVELETSREFAGADDAENHVKLAAAKQRLLRWLFTLLPDDAFDRDVYAAPPERGAVDVSSQKATSRSFRAPPIAHFDGGKYSSEDDGVEEDVRTFSITPRGDKAAFPPSPSGSSHGRVPSMHSLLGDDHHLHGHGMPPIMEDGSDEGAQEAASPLASDNPRFGSTSRRLRDSGQDLESKGDGDSKYDSD